MDYESYEGIFNSIKAKPLSIKETRDLYLEPGYAIVLSWLKTIGFERIGLFAFHMLLSLYFAHKAIMRYSSNVFVSWLILFGVYYANLFFNGIRQGLFIAIIFYMLPKLLVKSKKNFLIIVALSIFLNFTLHKTAVVLPFFYVLCFFEFENKNKYIILGISLIWAFMGVGDVLMKVSGLSIFKDSAYLGVVDFYTKNEAFGKQIDFFSISVLHRLLILVIALYFSNKKIADPLFQKITNIYFWGTIIYFVLAPLGYMLATRVSMNFKIFDVLLIPYFLVYIRGYQYKILGLIAISAWSFAVMLTNFYIPGNYIYYIPYRTIFSR